MIRITKQVAHAVTCNEYMNQLRYAARGRELKRRQREGKKDERRAGSGWRRKRAAKKGAAAGVSGRRWRTGSSPVGVSGT